MPPAWPSVREAQRPAMSDVTVSKRKKRRSETYTAPIAAILEG
jgi:hypothetical protein